MDISELIDSGLTISGRCRKNSEFSGEYYYGQEYEEWLTRAIRFTEIHFSGDIDTKRFREIAVVANGFGDEKFYPLIGILKAFKDYPPTPPKVDILPLLENICLNFNKFDVNIRRRHGNKETIKIEDEYDLQDALRSILRLFINDVRTEDYVPSYAGSNSRVDFLLPEYDIIIETKMTNSSLRDNEIGQQLTIDFNRYKQTKKCNHLICFVYDKAGNISNPSGLITDLVKLCDNDMRITVFISPQ